MKYAFIIFSILAATDSYGQYLSQQLADINTSKQAKNFLLKNPQFRGSLFQIDSNIDTSILQQQFYQKNSGDIFTIEKDTYKVLDAKTTILSRVNYIFLDGAQLKIKQIDTLRKFILNEYNKGVPFDTLAAKFNMDDNQNFGDTNWFADGVMAKEFSDAVKQHHLSDVFLVDIPGSRWYFVVKKTYESKQSKQMTILHLENGG